MMIKCVIYYMAKFKLSMHDLTSLFDTFDVYCSHSSIKTLFKWGKLDGFEQLLHTNYKQGLKRDKQEFKQRIQAYGANKPITRPLKSAWQLISEYCEDEMIRMMCIAAIVNLILKFFTYSGEGWWVEETTFLLAVSFMTVMYCVNNHLIERQFGKIEEPVVKSSSEVNVLRDGSLVKMSAFQLLVGDIVKIDAGDTLPADGLLIEGRITVDQSWLTGQSNDITKQVPITYQQIKTSPFLFSGSRVMSGKGLMVVAAVGANSCDGKMKIRLQVCRDQTKLQERLFYFAGDVGKVGIYAAIVFLSIMLIHFFYNCYLQDSFVHHLFSLRTVVQLIDYLILCLCFINLTVPEYMPRMASTAIAYAAINLKRLNNLVKDYSALQTMAGVDDIITDKTGTLTKFQMTVTRMFAEGTTHDNVIDKSLSQRSRRLISLAICANTKATPKFILENGTDWIAQLNRSNTDSALLLLAFEWGFDYKVHRNCQNIKKDFPFSADRKKTAAVYEDNDLRLYVFVRGNKQQMLPYCSHFVDKDGEISPINHQIFDGLANFANSCGRLLVLAFKEVSAIPDRWDQIENDLTLLALTNLKDPLRRGVPEAVAFFRQTGVAVRMVTGDSRQTAVAEAKQAGILPADWQPSEGDYTVMEGSQFRKLVGQLVTISQGDEVVESVGNLQNFKLVSQQLKVLARASPSDKYLLIVGLKGLGRAVAVTGDGNDVPSMKKAGVSFGMGILGNQITKQAAGIVLLDDSFTSIVPAMLWGINLVQSVRKALQFHLTAILVGIAAILIGCIILHQSPLNHVQILWIAVITDSFSVVALATQRPSSKRLMNKISSGDSLVTKNMWRFIVIQALVQIGVLVFVLLKGRQLLDQQKMQVFDQAIQSRKHLTVFFNVFVLLNVFNLFNARKLEQQQYNVFEGILSSKILLIIVATVLICQFLIVFFGKAVGNAALSVRECIICLLLSSISLFCCLLSKLVLPRNLRVSLNGVQCGSFKYYWKTVQQKEQ